MNEFETLLRAKSYIDKLSNGINPIDNMPIDEGEVVNNVRVSKCLKYVSEILFRVIENGGTVGKKEAKKSSSKNAKTEFTVSRRNLKKFRYSDEPINITELTARINELIDTELMNKLSYKKITGWLVTIDFLTEVINEEGKKSKRPTEMGKQFGIIEEERTGASGMNYKAVLYTKEAQEFIIENLNAAANIIEDEPVL